MDTLKLKTKVGQRYGLLVALESFKRPTSHGKNTFYRCQCDCGKIAEVHSDNLRSGKGGAKSCGCKHWYGSRTIDWTNQKINRLTPLYPTDKRAGKSIVWMCQCECGNKKEISAGEFSRGKTRSCGCLRLENKPPRYNPNRFEALIEDVYMDNIVKRSKEKGWVPPTVTLEDFRILSQRRCSYCNAYPSNHKTDQYSDFVAKYNGLDRFDNSLPYLIDNVVPCCWACNQIKLDRSVDEFLDRAISIYEKSRSALVINRDLGKSLISEYNTCHQTLYNSKIIKRTNELGFSLENILPLEDYAFLISQNCYYCDKEPSQNKKAYGRILKHNGIDRKNSDEGYVVDNCVPCCSKCNQLKVSMKDGLFIEMAKAVVMFLAPFKINRENAIKRILANNPLMKNPAV